MNRTNIELIQLLIDLDQQVSSIVNDDLRAAVNKFISKEAQSI